MPTKPFPVLIPCDYPSIRNALLSGNGVECQRSGLWYRVGGVIDNDRFFHTLAVKEIGGNGGWFIPDAARIVAGSLYSKTDASW